MPCVFIFLYGRTMVNFIRNFISHQIMCGDKDAPWYNNTRRISIHK